MNKSLRHSRGFARLSLCLAVPFCAALLLSPCLLFGDGGTYYVDSIRGNDRNDGMSGTNIHTARKAGHDTGPWRSLQKVNAAQLQPGDSVLFRRGCSWTGRLAPNGSGTEGNRIFIDAYGSGRRPSIDSRGRSESPLFLSGNEFIAVRNLELMNRSRTNGRFSGVLISLYNRSCRGITLQGLDIHDVSGRSEWTGAKKWDNAGIFATLWQDRKDQEVRLDGFLVEGCLIHDLSTTGIQLLSNSADKNRNVLIRSNIIDKTGADGIIVQNAENPRIVGNICRNAGYNGVDYRYIGGMWTMNCRDSLFRGNEVAFTRAMNSGGKWFYGDSVAFDIDGNDTGNPVIEYNYSHDNEGGFLLVMANSRIDRLDVRYNISVNDNHINCSRDSATLAIAHTNVFVYNNVFFNDAGEQIRTADLPSTYFYNNIFDSSAGFSFAGRPVYRYNCYHGQPPAVDDPHALLADPGFAASGAPGDGMASCEKYRLRPSSPCVDKGTNLARNGGSDFWGNPIRDGKTDIGAEESNR